MSFDDIGEHIQPNYVPVYRKVAVDSIISQYRTRVAQWVR